MRWRRRLTSLEIGLYAGLVALALMVFFERMQYYLELAERTAMEVTVVNVNSALAVRSAQAMLGGREAASGAHAFELVGTSPSNFRGAMASPDLGAVERGTWIYDANRKELIYVPRFRRGLTTSDPDQVLRYRTVVDGKITMSSAYFKIHLGVVKS